MSLSNDQCVRLLAFLLASEISHQNKQKKAKEMLWCLYILVQIPNSGHRWLLCAAVRLQEQVRLGGGGFLRRTQSTEITETTETRRLCVLRLDAESYAVDLRKIATFPLLQSACLRVVQEDGAPLVGRLPELGSRR